MTLSSAASNAPHPDTQPRQGLPAIVELGLVLGVFAAILAAGRLIGFAYGGVVAVLASAGLATVFLRLRGQSWRDLGLKGPRTLASLALGALIVIGVFVTAMLSHAVITPLLAQLLGSTERTMPNVATLPDYLIMLVIVWTTAAIGEELLFRGFLMTRIAELFGETKLGWAAAWLIAAALFGAAHAYQGVAGMLLAATAGAVFGMWYLLGRRNLIPLMIAHGLVSTTGVTLVFLTAQGVIDPSALAS